MNLLFDCNLISHESVFLCNPRVNPWVKKETNQNSLFSIKFLGFVFPNKAYWQLLFKAAINRNRFTRSWSFLEILTRDSF